VRVLRNHKNEGVGRTVLTGYSYACELGADILVKLDGDGQMDPRLIQKLIRPILEGRADDAKGNRLFNGDGLRSMPRLLGNASLSFLSKISSGYCPPANGVAFQKMGLPGWTRRTTQATSGKFCCFGGSMNL
jgi:glycosyltransferase involved in cell wall biosynthesis